MPLRHNTSLASSAVRSSALCLSFVAAALSAAPAFAGDTTTVDSIKAGQANIKAPQELPPARSTNQPLPAAPSPVANHRFGIVRQAGIGGPTAYARSGVLELGGGFGWTQASKNAAIGLRPTFGWFFADNFELSFIGDYKYGHQEGGLDSHLISLMLEPSVHIPVVDNLFLFAGWGLGAAISSSNPAAGADLVTNSGFAMTPRIGVNVLIGRSGILTPSVDLTFVSNDAVRINTPNSDTVTAAAVLNTRYGANITYGVMW